MSNISIPKLFAAVSALFTGLWVMLSAIDAVDWSEAQVGIVSATSVAVLGLGFALFAHLKPGTTAEPVAVSGAVTATTATVIALAVGFQWVHWTDAADRDGDGFLALLLNVAGVVLVRKAVTPVDSLPGPL